jgi:hypothetical protein
MQPRIYTYKITFEEVPYYYYGVHKENKFNDYYMGSPRTHKWCWELYTSKKQILEFFEYDDTGFLKAQEIEKQLIKSVYQTDKWCLNENCGGRISIEICKLNGEKTKDLKLGIHGLTDEQRSENAKKAGTTSYEKMVGIHSLSSEQKSKLGRIGGTVGGKTTFENKLGCFSLSPEERIEISRKVGLKTKAEKTGMFAMTFEEKSELMKKTNSQKWRCLVTGHIANAGNLAKFQKIKGIDVKLKERVE